MSSQITRCPELMKLARNHIVLVIDERGLSLGKMLGKNKYNWYYHRIHCLDYLDIGLINELLKIYLMKYKLRIIDNIIHKVYQSSMNN